MTGIKLIIAGGGIGGLTTALCLHELGFDVHIYESATEIKALGVGINVLPHAVRVLTRLGLEAELHKSAVATSELAYYSKHGKKIWQEPRGKFAGYNWPQFSIHRGTFQMLLLDAVTQRLGKQKIYTGLALEHAFNKDHFVEAHFTDRQTGAKYTIEADGLIAADGIHSAMRKRLYPDEG